MTGSSEPQPPAQPTGGGPEDREAAEIAAYLAAQDVANDYHPDSAPDVD